MASISGLVVNLVTFDSEDAGTDDEIFIGMWGNAGGREFPLSSSGHDDFERDADDLYVLGADPGFGFRQSDRSGPGEANDPALLPVELDSIQYVYVRKQAYGRKEDDNAWRLSSVIVLLYDAIVLPLPRSRLFSLSTRAGMWFGNEHGHQAWLTESRVLPQGVERFLGRFNNDTFAAAD